MLHEDVQRWVGELCMLKVKGAALLATELSLGVNAGAKCGDDSSVLMNIGSLLIKGGWGRGEDLVRV